MLARGNLDVLGWKYYFRVSVAGKAGEVGTAPGQLVIRALDFNPRTTLQRI